MVTWAAAMTAAMKNTAAGLGARLAARPPLHVEGASRPDPMARRGAAEPATRSIPKTLVNRRGPNGYPRELAAAGLEPATPGL